MDTANKRNVPRAHHFVPQCWLAGFTETGEKDGRLWVTDLKRHDQWQSTPAKAGYRRVFNRISISGVDPPYRQTFFSDVENETAPILKILDKRQPTSEEQSTLLSFMALQSVRVPFFRKTVREKTDAHL